MHIENYYKECLVYMLLSLLLLLLFTEAVEALMDPISHMKKQLRGLYEDLTDDEQLLCGQNPKLMVSG